MGARDGRADPVAVVVEVADARLAPIAHVLLQAGTPAGVVLGGDAGRTPRHAVMGELAAGEGAAAGVRPARAVPRSANAVAHAELSDTRRPRRPIVPATVVAGSAEAVSARRPRKSGAAQAVAALSISVQSVLGAGCITVPAAGLEGAGTGRPLRLVGSAAHAAVG